MKSTTIYLVACVKQKAPQRMPAKDLYESPWFRLARAFVESSGARWFILSAEHGLVPPSHELDPYDTALVDMSVSSRRSWARRVLAQFGEIGLSAPRVVFLAGKRYREFLEDDLRSRGVKVDIPMKDLRIGEQLHWLSQRVRPRRTSL